MADIYLGYLPQQFAIAGGLSLPDLAWKNPEGDLKATEIIVALSKKVSEELAKSNPENILPFSYRLAPITKLLERDTLSPNLHKIFTFAASLHGEVAKQEHIIGEGYPHHFKFEADDAGAYVLKDAEIWSMPELSSLATLSINPYWAAKYPDAPVITLDEGRYDRQVNKIAELTGKSRENAAKASLLNILHIAARRVDGTPEGQVPLEYFLKIGKIASKVAGAGLDSSLFEVPKVA